MLFIYDGFVSLRLVLIKIRQHPRLSRQLGTHIDASLTFFHCPSAAAYLLSRTHAYCLVRVYPTLSCWRITILAPNVERRLLQEKGDERWCLFPGRQALKLTRKPAGQAGLCCKILVCSVCGRRPMANGCNLQNVKNIGLKNLPVPRTLVATTV